MRLISHRGNVDGPVPELENEPSYIDRALSLGHDVEIDVWKLGAELYLGHDRPQYRIGSDFFYSRPQLWCHAKNLEALAWMINNGIHCFWHQTDDVALTSEGYFWVYPGRPLTANGASSIAVMPEMASGWDVSEAWGICTDYIGKYGNA